MSRRSSSLPVIYGISDESIAEVERLCNASIRELVMATVHAENDETDDAQNCLSQVHLNIDNLQHYLADCEKEISAANAKGQS